jgi:hypothetical protein
MKTIYQSNLPIILLVLTLLVLPLIIGQSEELTSVQLNSIADRSTGKRIQFEGFEGLKLGDDGITVTSENGLAKVNLENLPNDVEGIEYKGGAFIYKIKDKGTISIAKGQIDEDLKYAREGLTEEVILDINEGSSITITEKGEFQMDGNSQITIKDRIFKPMGGGKGELSIEYDSYYRGKNLDIDTDSTTLNIGDKVTDVLFNNDDTNAEQFVRITHDNNINDITVVGEDITLDLKEENLPDNEIKMFVDGQGITIKNGGKILKKTESEIGLNRKPNGPPAANAQIVTTDNSGMKVTEAEGKTTVSIEDATYVQIGGYNEILTNPKAAGTYASTEGLAGSEPNIEDRGLLEPIIPDSSFFGIKSPNEIKLFDNIYSVDNAQLPRFFEEARTAGITTEQGLADALVGYAQKNIEVVTTAKFDEIPTKSFGQGLNDFIKELDLPGTKSSGLTGEVYAFTNKLIKSQGKNIPLGTKIIVISDERKVPLTGVIKIVQEGKVYEISLPGSYVKKYIDTQLNNKKLTRDNLWDKYEAYKASTK